MITKHMKEFKVRIIDYEDGSCYGTCHEIESWKVREGQDVSELGLTLFMRLIESTAIDWAKAKKLTLPATVYVMIRTRVDPDELDPDSYVGFVQCRTV